MRFCVLFDSGTNISIAFGQFHGMVLCVLAVLCHPTACFENIYLYLYTFQPFNI